MFRLITSSNAANVPDDLEALANAARSSCPILDFKARATDSNGLDVVRLKRSTSTFLTGIGSFLSGTQSHAARLDTVEDRVVPVSVEPCDFGIRVEMQNVAVGDVYVLALLCNPRQFGRYRPAHFSLDHDYVPVGRDQSITLTRKFGTALGNARQITSMPPRIGTTLSRPYGAYRPSAPSAQRASMPSTSWAS